MRTTQALGVVAVVTSAAAAAAGCGDEAEESRDSGSDAAEIGDAAVCLASSALALEKGELYVWDISGTVIEDAPSVGALDTPLRCGDAVRRVLTVEDEQGTRWQVGYAVLDGSGADVTPALAVAPGDRVSVRVRATVSFGDAFGLVVRDAAGAPIAAVEVGTWGAALTAEDLPEVSVSAGAVDAQVEGGCGTLEYRAQRFLVGDDGSEIVPFGTGSLSVAGQTLTLYAIAQWDFLPPVGCTDVAGQSLWALFR